jgi:DNA-directed RNA polymerase specialized sigma24 family protein
MNSSLSGGSITLWLNQLKSGDPEAVGLLWATYFTRLTAAARARLRTAPRGRADEEDVALSAFDSFCRRAERGQFPNLDDRDDLWQVLLTIADRKAAQLVRDEMRLKRGGGRVVQASVLDAAGGSGADVFGATVGAEPTPEFAAQVAEEYERLLSLLDESELRAIAVWKMEGYTNSEVAARIGRAEVTVERKLARIRRKWGGPDQPQ